MADAYDLMVERCDALAAEVSALRAALEAAETDAQLCRERLGDERERRRAAEALAVPEGWKVEWGHSICTYPGCEGGELVNPRCLPHEVTDLYPTVVVCPRCLGSAQRPGGPLPRLVPLSPTDTPEVSP